MLEFLLETKLYIANVFEAIAAFAGILYLTKAVNVSTEIRYFVYYLILVLLLELYGYIPIYAYLRNYEVLSFYEDSVFRRNLWWANGLNVLSTLCISWIFIKALSVPVIEHRFKWLLFFYVIFSVISFSAFGDYFNAYDPYVLILGVFILLISVGLYYFNTLKSEKILNFYGDIRFYISFGTVIWSLCIVPLNLYSNFYTLKNPLYMELSILFLRFGSVFLYSVFTIGFYMDYKFKKKALILDN